MRKLDKKQNLAQAIPRHDTDDEKAALGSTLRWITECNTPSVMRCFSPKPSSPGFDVWAGWG